MYLPGILTRILAHQISHNLPYKADIANRTRWVTQGKLGDAQAKQK